MVQVPQFGSILSAFAVARAACGSPAFALDTEDGEDLTLSLQVAPPGVSQGKKADLVVAPEKPEERSDEEPEKKGFFRQFTDEEDGKVDFSNFLAKGGFIPLPIIITEPAVEGGYGVAAVLLRVPKDNPKNVTRRVIAAFKTRNGSRGFGYFQSGFAFDGRLNYRFGAGRGKFNLEAFPRFAPDGVKYTNHYDYGIMGSALWSLGSGFSVGPLLDFRKLKSELEIAGAPDIFDRDFNDTLHTGALGLGLHFDSRDNTLTPKNGINAYVEGKFNRGTFGSDRDFEDYDANLFWFRELNPKIRSAFKLKLDAIRGDYPVYFAPSIELRGVQAIRYQGQNVASSEAELTWQLNKRWSLLAFGGVGTAKAGGRRIYKDSGLIAAGGGGFRYRLARKLGLDAGLDLAYGPGGLVFYIQLGHAWSLRMD